MRDHEPERRARGECGICNDVFSSWESLVESDEEATWSGPDEDSAGCYTAIGICLHCASLGFRLNPNNARCVCCGRWARYDEKPMNDGYGESVCVDCLQLEYARDLADMEKRDEQAS